jgi:hypothetical protein
MECTVVFFSLFLFFFFFFFTGFFFCMNFSGFFSFNFYFCFGALVILKLFLNSYFSSTVSGSFFNTNS